MLEHRNVLHFASHEECQMNMEMCIAWKSHYFLDCTQLPWDQCIDSVKCPAYSPTDTGIGYQLQATLKTSQMQQKNWCFDFLCVLHILLR